MKKTLLTLATVVATLGASFAQKPQVNCSRVVNNDGAQFLTGNETWQTSGANQRASGASLNETFETTTFSKGWSSTDFFLSKLSNTQMNYSNPTAFAAGARPGFAYFLAYSRLPGVVGTLTSTVLDPDANNPTLSYKVNYYVINSAWKDKGANLYIDISEDFGKNWIKDDVDVLSSLPDYNTKTTGWQPLLVDLSTYAGKKVMVRFRAVADYGMASIGIDDVQGPSVFDITNDIVGKRLSVSMNGTGYSKLTPVSQLDSVYVGASVTNNGSQPQTNVRLKVNINNDVDFATGFKNPIVSLASGKTDTIWVAAKPKEVNDTTSVSYGAKIVVEQNEADEISFNNVLDSLKFQGTVTSFLRTDNLTALLGSYSFAAPATPTANGYKPKSGLEFGAKYFITSDTRVDSIFAYIYKFVGSGNVVGKLYTITNGTVFTQVASTDPYQPESRSFRTVAFKTPYQCPKNTMLAATIQFNGDMETTKSDTILTGTDTQFLSNPAGASVAYLNAYTGSTQSETMKWLNISGVPLVGIDLQKPDLSTVTKLNQLNASDFVVYPNPSNGVVSIKNLTNNSMVELVNILGEVLYKGKVSGTATTLDFSSLPTANYYLKVTNAEGLYTVKKLQFVN